MIFRKNDLITCVRGERNTPFHEKKYLRLDIKIRSFQFGRDPDKNYTVA